MGFIFIEMILTLYSIREINNKLFYRIFFNTFL